MRVFFIACSSRCLVRRRAAASAPRQRAEYGKSLRARGYDGLLGRFS